MMDSQERNITGADITRWELRGLKEGSLYRFHLSACTQAGCGPPQAQESRTVSVEGEEIKSVLEVGLMIAFAWVKTHKKVFLKHKDQVQIQDIGKTFLQILVTFSVCLNKKTRSCF